MPAGTQARRGEAIRGPARSTRTYEERGPRPAVPRRPAALSSRRGSPGRTVSHHPHFCVQIDVGQRIGQRRQVPPLDGPGLFDLGPHPAVVALKDHPSSPRRPGSAARPGGELAQREKRGLEIADGALVLASSFGEARPQHPRARRQVPEARPALGRPPTEGLLSDRSRTIRGRSPPSEFVTRNRFFHVPRGNRSSGSALEFGSSGIAPTAPASAKAVRRVDRAVPQDPQRQAHRPHTRPKWQRPRS